MTEVRKCSRCKVIKPITQFTVRRTFRAGQVIAECNPCKVARHRAYRKANPQRVKEVERRSQLKRKYGITPAEYDATLESQQSTCAICGSSASGGRSSTFPVDHCHRTGKVRGILCTKCNRGLGLFNDDILRLRRAADYLERNYDGDYTGDGD